MSRTLKILLIVAAACLLLLVVVAFVFFRFVSAHKDEWLTKGRDTMQEGMQAGRGMRDADCFEKAIALHREGGSGFAGLGGDGLGGGRLDGNDLVGDRGRTAAFDAGIHGRGEAEGVRRNAVELEADPANRLGDSDDAGGLLVADALARAGGTDEGYPVIRGELIVDQSQSGSRNGSGGVALRIAEATGQLGGGVGRGGGAAGGGVRRRRDAGEGLSGGPGGAAGRAAGGRPGAD